MVASFAVFRLRRLALRLSELSGCLCVLGSPRNTMYRFTFSTWKAGSSGKALGEHQKVSEARSQHHKVCHTRYRPPLCSKGLEDHAHECMTFERTWPWFAPAMARRRFAKQIGSEKVARQGCT